MSGAACDYHAVRPSAVCFDFDSTLLDNSGFRATVRHTCATIAARHPSLEAERLLTANTEVWDAYWPSIERQWELGGISGAEVSLEGWRRTLRAAGCEDASIEEIAREAGEVQRAHRGATVRLFPDARGILEAVTRAGIPLALITNAASDAQRISLGRHDIERYFRAIVISGEHGVAKPDPAIFRIALDRLGLSPEELSHPRNVWHVGDNPHTDVAGAKAAGLTAIWLNRKRLPLPTTALHPDHEIHSLTELSGLLGLEA